MARLSIDLPDELRAKMEARAAEAGHVTIEQYVEALVLADVGPSEDYGAPAHLTLRGSDDVRDKLREGLASGPAVEMRPADWEARRTALRERHNTEADAR